MVRIRLEMSSRLARRGNISLDYPEDGRTAARGSGKIRPNRAVCLKSPIRRITILSFGASFAS